MWKLIGGMSLFLCVTAMADDPAPKPSVFVECCGRLRHGIVAIGGETTGTTITFNRTTWELQFHDEAARAFARAHHKDSVVAIGALRKVAGVERKNRWIIDVKTIAVSDEAKDKHGTRIGIRGVLQLADDGPNDSPGMTIVANGHVWPLDLSANSRLRSTADGLVGHRVLLMGHLQHTAEEESTVTSVAVRVKTLKRSDSPPRRHHH